MNSLKASKKDQQAEPGLHVIVGLGKTGLACAQYLSRKNISIAITDTRDAPPELATLKTCLPNVPVAFGALDERLLLQATRIVLSPGVSKRHPALVACKVAGIPLIGDMELFAEQVQAPVIAITGTNGKSTVTRLVGDMIEQAGYRVLVGGNIGIPVLALLDEPSPDFYVLECSSFQLETTSSLLPRIACVLNISPDHLDRHPTMQAYIKAKQRIYKNCAIAVFNRDDDKTMPSHTIESVTFGMDRPMSGMFGMGKREDKTYLMFGEQALLSINELSLVGQHNALNVLAALAIGHVLELPMSSMLKIARHFCGLSHRCCRVRELDGVTFYNDSKATNVGASVATIQGLAHQIPGKIVLIAGGQGKRTDFSELFDVVASHVKTVIVMGETALELQTCLKDAAPVEIAQSMQQAVSLARKLSNPGDAVLLAPACTSFDMFRNFEHRGEVFEALTRELT